MYKIDVGFGILLFLLPKYKSEVRIHEINKLVLACLKIFVNETTFFSKLLYI